MTNYAILGAKRADGSITDLFVADGVLVAERPDDAEVIEADGLMALPGLVDLHTHLREPGREDAETVASGTAAAARGGFTCVHAMANTDPVTDTAEKCEHISFLGERDGLAQVVPVGAITKGLEGKELSEMGLMAASPSKVRIFSDDGKCVMDALIMRRALEWVKPFGGIIAQHAQDANLADGKACCDEGPWSGRLGLQGWPAAAESSIIARDVELAALTGSRVHVCHVSTVEGVEVVRWAKSRGINVTAEATPHHLLLGTGEVAHYDTTFKVNPPLRADDDIEAVRAALTDGTIDIVGTDHAPHAPQDKDHPFPDARPGMLGLEQALAVVMEVMVNTGRMTWEDVVRVMSTKPAEMGQVENQGRPLEVGEPANIVLIDTERRAIVDRNASASKSRNNPYHGRELPDPIELTMWAGRITYRR